MSSDYDKMYASETLRFGNIKKFIDAQINKNDLNKYFNYYFREMFGGMDFSELKRFGLTLEPFKRCAYFDLYKAKLKSSWSDRKT